MDLDNSFSLKKYLNENRGKQVLAGESDVDWIVYRYAETLLFTFNNGED